MDSDSPAAAPFPPGSVAETLSRMVGVWHDHIQVFDLSGRPLPVDEHSGAPGPAPWDNLVYIDFDGRHYRQTNVTFRGRPVHVRSFAGELQDGVLVFHKLGPEAPEHIGVSGGPGVLFFAPRRVDEAWQRYSEPDCIRLISDSQRTRTTLLYRYGAAVRTLTANGIRLTRDTRRRVALDPRSLAGPVHPAPSETSVFRAGQAPADRLG
jgi:hypothetical protein